jgi:hypothetical protein
MGASPNPLSATSLSESIGVKAIAAIPIVGGILAPIASAITGIFAASHAQAVAKEASTLNNAVPVFKSTIQAIMAAANSGEITPAQAISYLTTAQANYYSAVASIIKKGGSCDGSCMIGTESSAGKPAGWVSTEPVCCNTSGTCNAACCLGCYMIEPTVTGLIQAIKNGSGSVAVPSSQQNGAIAPTPAFVLTYSTPSILSRIEQTIFGELSKL